jgi:hypothetical protein
VKRSSFYPYPIYFLFNDFFSGQGEVVLAVDAAVDDGGAGGQGRKIFGSVTNDPD